MEVRVEDGVYVFDVEIEEGGKETITLDSGAGKSVWPKGRAAGKSRVVKSNDNTKLVAANGTEIKNFGVRQVAFKGVKVPSENDESTDFVGQA